MEYNGIEYRTFSDTTILYDGHLHDIPWANSENPPRSATAAQLPKSHAHAPGTRRKDHCAEWWVAMAGSPSCTVCMIIIIIIIIIIIVTYCM